MKLIIQYKFLYACIFISLLLHLISAYFSFGFYSDDEHFQILEISAYLLGINEVAIDDTRGYYWEWRDHIRMRPWLQPLLYFYFINFFKFFNINDPFIWAFLIRLIASLFGFISLLVLFFTFKNYFLNKNYKFNLIIYFTFWFYPFIHSRTSSENLGITLFIISMSFIYKLVKSENIYLKNLRLFCASYFLGIAMVVKFTLVFSIIPIFLYILFKIRKFFLLLIFCLSIFISLITGVLIDSLMWERLSNTYFQFYKFNLTEDYGRLNDFGIEPWYYYFSEITKQLAPILSIFFLIGMIFHWIKKPFHILSLITFSTLLIFMIIGHKEVRYIFPIYIFAPLFIIYFLNNFSNLNYLNLIKILAIFSNVIFLLIALFYPFNEKVAIYKFVHKNVSKNEIVYYLNENPYKVNDMEPFFYTSFLPKINKLPPKILNSNDFWLITNNFFELDNYIKENCKIKYSTYPLFIYKLKDYLTNLKTKWFILNCKIN